MDTSKKLLELLQKQARDKKQQELDKSLNNLLEKLDGNIDDLKGSKGDQGDKGEKGDQGIIGTPGKNGIDGKNGLNGVNGRDGIHGIDGLPGKDGLNGNNGSPDTADDIRNKLELLQGPDRIKISAIGGLDTFADDIYGKVNGVIESLDNHRVFGIKLNGQRKPQANQINFIHPLITITHDGEQGVNVDLSAITGGAGSSPSIGGAITGGTAGSVLFVSPSGIIAQDNNNFYLQDNSLTPQQLATNTNVAFSINTGGDFTGTDAVNIYGQYDAFLLNSQITNSLTGLNTDGAFPGYSSSSSRGTAISLAQLQTGDMVGGYFGFGTQGSTSPIYQNLGGMSISTTGSSVNNLGGELRWYTKNDGGSLVQQMTLNNAGMFGIGGEAAPTHTLTLPSGVNGIALYNTADQTTNFERVVTGFVSNVYTIGSAAGGTGLTRPISLSAPFTQVIVSNAFGSVSGVGAAGFNATGTSSGGTYFSIFHSGNTSSSAMVNTLGIIPTFNQSGTAGLRAVWISPFLQAVGSGNKFIIDIGINSAANAGGTHTPYFTVSSLGDIGLSKTITATGTNGAQTINKPTGSVNFAIGATSLVVTNALVTANSVIQVTVQGGDVTMTSAGITQTAGSFTIIPNAAPTAANRVNFTITN